MRAVNPRMMRLRSSGAIVFDHPCQTCAKPHAPLGRKVSLLHAPKSLGEWFCDTFCRDIYDKVHAPVEYKAPQSPQQLSLF